MKQEYTDRMKEYQQDTQQQLLKSKNVLDAWQYLYSSILHLNYAVITAKLYEDVGKENIRESNQSPFYNGVKILNWNYNAHTFLNKLAAEWVSHISNVLDCLLQYINASLNLGITVNSVGAKSIASKITESALLNKCNDLWKDDKVMHILSINNYSKHTLTFYGNSSFTDVINEQRDIKIPSFRYRSHEYSEISVNELMDGYEEFIGKYLDVLDAINDIVSNSAPVSNRYYVDGVRIDGKLLGTDNALVLLMDFQEDGIHVKNYRFEDVSFAMNGTVEIMLNRSKNTGQHLGYIQTIQVYKEGIHVANLDMVSPPENSTLTYCKYNITTVG